MTDAMARLRHSIPAAFALAALFTVVIGALSLGPRFRRISRLEDEDKVGHGVAYAVLTAAWARALRLSGRGRAPAGLAAFVLCAGYGGAIEVVQPCVGRTCDVRDGLWNALGATLGAAAVGLPRAVPLAIVALACLQGAAGCASAPAPLDGARGERGADGARVERGGDGARGGERGAAGLRPR